MFQEYLDDIEALKKIVEEWYEKQIVLVGNTEDSQKRLVILGNMDKIVANI